jgi:hypothetical protein
MAVPANKLARSLKGWKRMWLRSLWPMTSTPSPSGLDSYPQIGAAGFQKTARHTPRPSFSWSAKAIRKISTCVKGGVVLVEISIAQLDRELAAISHGVARIQSEVEKGVFELSHFHMQR